MIGLTESDNWLLAIRTTLPAAVEELQARIAKLDAEKAKCQELMHDYEDLIAIASRRDSAAAVEMLVAESRGDYTRQGRD